MGRTLYSVLFSGQHFTGHCSLGRIIPPGTFVLMDLFLLGRIKWVLLQEGGQTSDSESAHFKPFPVRLREREGYLHTKYGNQHNIGCPLSDRVSLKQSLLLSRDCLS